MRPLSTLPTLALALLAVLAGCTVGYTGESGPTAPAANDSSSTAVPREPSATPTPYPRPDVTVHLVNAGDDPYRVRALVFDPAARQARVTYANGTTTTVEGLTDVNGIRLFSPEAATAVEPLARTESLGDRTVTVAPGANERVVFEAVPHGSGLFVVVTTDDGRVFEWVTATCGGGFQHNSLSLELGTYPRASLSCEFAPGV